MLTDDQLKTYHQNRMESAMSLQDLNDHGTPLLPLSVNCELPSFEKDSGMASSYLYTVLNLEFSFF